MYFSIEPKKTREDLYDRQKELQELRNAVRDGRLVLLYGLRRIGKTSLIQVFFEESAKEFIHVFMDCRSFVRNGRITRSTFDGSFLENVKTALKKEKLKDILGTISKISVAGVEFDLSKKKSNVDLFSYLDRINEGLQKSGKKMIIALDEAQNLRFYGRGGKDILNLFAHVYDYLGSISLILTGSEVGLLHDFLKSDDPEAPLFGRYINEISLERFQREKSVDFLSKGFNQVGIEIEKDEIEKAVEVLDGIVGYLAMYGFVVYSKKDVPTALEETKKMAQKLVKKEIDELRNRTENYLYILKAVAFGIDRFSTIKEYVSIHHDRITDQTLSNNLSTLVKQGFLEEKYKELSKNYTIPDPMIKIAVLEMS